MKNSETLENFSAKLIISALRLTRGPQGMSLGALVHLLPFLAGERSACRLVLPRDAASVFASEVRASGRVAVLASLSRFERGPDWFEFARGDAVSAEQLLVLATDRAVADELVDAEFGGRFRDSGRLLEYPACCVNAYGMLCEEADYWPNHYIRQSNIVSPWCNRLVYLWGDCCPTGELFPCSLTCSHAVALGKKNMEVLTTLGLERLREEIYTQATVPLFVKSDGRVYRGIPASAGDREIVVDIL